MSSTGSPERCTSAKTTSDTPTATIAAWPRRRRTKGSASGLHVRVARPEEVVRAHLEPLDLLREAEQLVELPEEDPHSLVVETFQRLCPQLAAALGVERALVLLDGLQQVAGGVEVAERLEVRPEPLHGVRGVPRPVDEGVVEAVLERGARRALVVLGPLE